MAIINNASLIASIAMKDPTNTVGKGLGTVVKALTPTGVVGDGITKATSIYWRNALRINRATSNKRKDIITSKKDPAKGKISISPRKSYPKIYSDNDNPERIDVQVKRSTRTGKISLTDNKVIIYNLSVSPYQYIELQNRPTEIENQSQTSWAEIKSMGRNLPMYHYLGGEDEIHFNTSWFVNDPEHPEEVLVKCRLLESWTKANGYSFAPPILIIQWGNADIFKDQLFILTSATYTLSNFSAKCFGIKDKQSSSIIYGNNPNMVDTDKIIDAGLLPRNATQELIFKRVSGHNLTSQDYVKDVAGIKGIDYQKPESQSQSIV